jgi:arginase
VTAPVVVIGVPTALGGNLATNPEAARGMARAPAELRRAGLLDRLSTAGLTILDAGDVSIEPGYREDPDPRAKNRSLLLATMPRVVEAVADTLRADELDARLLVLGGDCTVQTAALAGIRRARPGARIALVWFDAHGDFNTPDTTPSGNVWGMPFAMACGRGDPDLVGAVDGPVVREEDCALVGGQVLDEMESRMLAASHVAQFGAGMLATDAGMAALTAWTGAVARRVDGFYVALDHDCLDASLAPAVSMPEPDGMMPDVALAAIRTIAAAGPVLAHGASAMSLGNGDAARTVSIAADLAAASLAGRAG